MNFIRPTHRFAIATIAVLTAACSDAPTILSPSLQPPSTSLHEVTVAFLRANPGYHLGTQAVQWAASHGNAQYSESALITAAAGGTISLPGADFTITFPAGALSQDLTITVVALGGPSVAYDLLPHGTQFNTPVVATQQLANTSVGGLTGLIPALYAGYLPDGYETISSTGGARAVEIETSTTIFNLSGTPVTQLWSLHHFSKYILASGDAPPVSDGSGS